MYKISVVLQHEHCQHHAVFIACWVLHETMYVRLELKLVQW